MWPTPAAPRFVSAGAARRPGETTERCSRRAAAAQRDPPQPAGWNRTVLPEPGFGATGDVHPEGSQHIHHPAGIVGGDYRPHNPIQVNNERHVLARSAEVETEPVDQIAAAMDPPSAQRPQGNPAHLADGGVRYALRAGREVVVDCRQDRPPPSQPPAHTPRLCTHQQAAAWLETERPNLLAAADHAAAHGWTLHAVQIPAAIGDLLLIRGDWDQAAALHQTALTAAKRAGDRPGQAGALNHLGILHQLTGDFRAAASLAQAEELYRDLGDQPGQARTLTQLAFLRSQAGDYPAATAISRRALALACGSGDRLSRADALNCLGMVQQETGDYTAAAALRQALALFRGLGYRLGEANALTDLGVVQQETADYPAAAASLRQALALFRGLGHRLGEAWALGGLGVVQQETGDYRAAAASFEQALKLYRDLGHHPGQAEALNRLGELASATSGTHEARECHARALAIARDFGVPVEEARALEGIGQAHLQDGNRAESSAHLHQALAIYQRIGSPGVWRVQQTLREHGRQPSSPQPAP
jgi:tetratricopeptide (TPR) repeat protein